jgi:colanic acid biosynthesis glycosyl transferase WcaI
LAIARSETRRADRPIYGIAAASRPIVVIGAAYGELAGLVREHGCGAVVEPGNAAALTTVLRRLAIDPEMAAAMGHRAWNMLDAHFSRRHALEKWQALLDELDRRTGTFG